MKSRLLSACAVLCLCFSSAAHTGASAPASDWPQWRGPSRDGVSSERGLLRQWPAGGPRLLWQLHDIGDGYSTPAVAGSRVFLMSNRGMENEFVTALSAKDGKTLWTTRVGNVGNPGQNPPYAKARSTPTVDGDLLYALGSDGDLACLETKTGKIRWQKNIRKELGGVPGEWAYAESPLVDGDLVVVTPGGAEAAMAALNKRTGAVVWKAAVPGGEPAGYASSVVAHGGGRKQYVQLLSKGLIGVDARTGGVLWRYKEAAKGPAQYFTPVGREGLIYCGALGIGGALVRLKPDGTAEQVYFTRGLPNGIGGAVLVGDTLYGADMPGQRLLAVEFGTGQVKWQTENFGWSSLASADGLLFIHGTDGSVGLAEATPEGYRERGRFTPPNLPKKKQAGTFAEGAFAYPVVADGRLYIRDLGSLWVYDIKARK